MDATDNDAAYYRKREQHELDLAVAAKLEDIRKIHLTLAEKYRSLAEDAET